MSNYPLCGSDKTVSNGTVRALRNVSAKIVTTSSHAPNLSVNYNSKAFSCSALPA